MPSLLRPMVFKSMHFDRDRLCPGLVIAFAMIALIEKVLYCFEFFKVASSCCCFNIHISLGFMSPLLVIQEPPQPSKGCY
jgi:hypothetical protein